MILEPISSTFLGGGTCRYGANFRTWAVRGLSVQPFDPFEATGRGRLLDPLAVEAPTPPLDQRDAITDDQYSANVSYDADGFF